MNLSENDGISQNPSMSAIENMVHVVWEDSTPGNAEILYTRSLDDGANFSPIESLSINTVGASVPAIIALESNVYVAWSDSTPGNPDILFRRSANNGANFGPSENLSNCCGFSNGPAIAAIESNVYVVWGDDISGNWEILYRKSVNSGVTFEPISSNLSTNTGTSDAPAIAVS